MRLVLLVDSLDCVPILLLFCHAHLAIDSQNSIVIISSTVIHDTSSNITPSNNNGYSPFTSLDSALLKTTLKSSSLAASLALALAYCAKKPSESRFIVISSTRDNPAQYMHCMNAMFAAQRNNVVIDALRLAKTPSVHLMQIANATQGIYLPVEHENLLQTLLVTFS